MVRVLTLEEATLAYRSSRGTIVSAIKNGTLPGYRLKSRWYTFAPEVAFAGVIDLYNQKALEYKAMLTAREIADLLGVTPGNIHQLVHAKHFPKGQMVGGIRMWDLITVRKLLQRREGGTNRGMASYSYSKTMVDWARERLGYDPTERLRSVRDLDEVLEAILELPHDEQVKELNKLYAAADLLGQTKAVSRRKI